MNVKLTINNVEVQMGVEFQIKIVDAIPDTVAYQDLFLELAKSKITGIRRDVANKSKISEETALLLLADKKSEVLDLILSNDMGKALVTTEQLIGYLDWASSDVVERIISQLSEYEDIDTKGVMQGILGLDNPSYELAIVESWNMPKQFLKELVKSSDQDVKAAAEDRLMRY